jgi:hypothetical protein
MRVYLYFTFLSDEWAWLPTAGESVQEMHQTTRRNNKIRTAIVVFRAPQATGLTPTYRARGPTTTVLMGSFGTGRKRPASEEPPLAFPMPSVRFCYNFVLRIGHCGHPYDFSFREKRAGTYASGEAESFGQQDQGSPFRNR